VLTHHWLVRRRGGERVLEALCELLPGAPIYTLLADRRLAGPLAERCGWRLPAGHRIHPSLLQVWPGVTGCYPALLPLMPLAARLLRLPPAELVVCSDAAIAKAMRVHPSSRLICYCHSPMRYVWEPEISRQYMSTLPRPLRPLWPALCRYVRECDRRAAGQVDLFIANSHHVAGRIRRCYGRESRVVYPPVELPAAPAAGPREDFLLCVGHQVAYKRLDLAVEACRRLGRPLVVIGDGPQVERLRRRAPDGALIRLLGYQPDEIVVEHYRRAAALLFPGEEDFGIVPVEAMAHGCPVVAYAAGGACETVVDGVTGVLFGQQTVDELVSAIGRLAELRFYPVEMHARMQRFGRPRFLSEMREILAAT
jgi:glycosyltransferase involved in cell wall biosynthesis